MKNIAWKTLAYVVSRRPVADWLIRRAKRTPYFHLEGYMDRYWLFNPTFEGDKPRRFEWLPSIRIHHILRKDIGRDCHNHPWDFRTIILRGYYFEHIPAAPAGRAMGLRKRGYTGLTKAGDFHHIASVSPDGVWTLFFHWKWQHTWGFSTAQGFVPWKEYANSEPSKAAERN